MLGINALFRTEYQILILYNFFQTPGLILSDDKTHQSSVALSPLWSGPLEQFPPSDDILTQISSLEYFLFVILTLWLPYFRSWLEPFKMM